MYEDFFIVLSNKQIKMLNATELAAKHKCSQSYVSRILKSSVKPSSIKAQAILKDAYTLIKIYQDDIDKT